MRTGRGFRLLGLLSVTGGGLLFVALRFGGVWAWTAAVSVLIGLFALMVLLGVQEAFDYRDRRTAREPYIVLPIFAEETLIGGNCGVVLSRSKSEEVTHAALGTEIGRVWRRSLGREVWKIYSQLLHCAIDVVEVHVAAQDWITLQRDCGGAAVRLSTLALQPPGQSVIQEIALAWTLRQAKSKEQPSVLQAHGHTMASHEGLPATASPAILRRRAV